MNHAAPKSRWRLQPRTVPHPVAGGAHPLAFGQMDLLLSEKILVTQGTEFNWPAPDHLRIVTLPWSRDLSSAIERLGNFLVSYRR